MVVQMPQKYAQRSITETPTVAPRYNQRLYFDITYCAELDWIEYLNWIKLASHMLGVMYPETCAGQLDKRFFEEQSCW